jgi:hypothetical protein
MTRQSIEMKAIRSTKDGYRSSRPGILAGSASRLADSINLRPCARNIPNPCSRSNNILRLYDIDQAIFTCIANILTLALERAAQCEVPLISDDRAGVRSSRRE